MAGMDDLGDELDMQIYCNEKSVYLDPPEPKDPVAAAAWDSSKSLWIYGQFYDQETQCAIACSVAQSGSQSALKPRKTMGQLGMSYCIHGMFHRRSFEAIIVR